MLEKKEKRGSRKIDFEVSRLLRPVISGIISQNSCLLNLCFYYFCKHFYNQDSKYDIYTFIFIGNTIKKFGVLKRKVKMKLH